MMQRRIVIEAVMIAIHGQMLVPKRPVEYLIPYSTVHELYEMKDSDDPILPDADEDKHVRKIIGDLIQFFEDPFNRKKIERSLQSPWKFSPPMPVNERVSLTVVNAMENMQFGEMFDPVETELILLAQREAAPIVTDQLEFEDKVVEAGIEVEVYDIEDFEFAVEGGITVEDVDRL